MSAPVFDLETIIAIGQQAGELVQTMRRDGLRNVQDKSSVIDLVTEADVASEKFIRAALYELYPFVGFWGEESNTAPHEEFFWLVDPIDGTTNYANGLPLYSINIGLQQGEKALIGVTVQLPTGQIYWAQRGEGAYLRATNGTEQRLQVNQVNTLVRALVTTGFPYHRAESPDNNSAEFNYFLTHCQGVRCMGSAALDMAHVAGGALAAFWEGWLNPWDVGPGALMVHEAGGLVTDYAGRPWTLGSRTLVASNGQPALHQALLEGIQQARIGLTETRLSML